MVFHLETGLGWQKFYQMSVCLLLQFLRPHHSVPLWLFHKMFYMGIPLWKSPAQAEFLIDSQLALVNYKGLGCAMQVNMKSTNTGTVQVYFVHIIYILLRWVPWMQSMVLFTSWTAPGVKHSCGFLLLCHSALGWLRVLTRKLQSCSFFPQVAVSQRRNHFTSLSCSKLESVTSPRQALQPCLIKVLTMNLTNYFS